MRGSARIARAIATRWRWPPGELDAALADDRVVLLLEPLDELVGVRDMADGPNLLHRRVRPAVADVVADRAVEQEVVLQHDAELRAVVAQAHVREVVAVDENPPGFRPVERHHEADERALPRSAGADERGRRAGRRAEGHVLEHRHALVVLEAHVVERDLAVNPPERLARVVLVVLASSSSSDRGCDRARRTLR